MAIVWWGVGGVGGGVPLAYGSMKEEFLRGASWYARGFGYKGENFYSRGLKSTWSDPCLPTVFWMGFRTRSQ